MESRGTELRRRKLLALGGALGVSSLAGCLDSSDPTDDQQVDDRPESIATPADDELPLGDEGSADDPTGESSGADGADGQDGSSSLDDSSGPDERRTGSSPPDEPSGTDGSGGQGDSDHSSDDPSDELGEDTHSSSEFDPTAYVDDWQNDRVRGEAAAIEAEQTVESAVVAEGRCASVGKDAVGSFVNDRLHEPAAYYGVGEDPEHDHVVLVGRTLTVERNGSVSLSPDVPFDLLRSVTPRTVQVTVHHEETEQHSEVPVVLQDRVLFYT